MHAHLPTSTVFRFEGPMRNLGGAKDPEWQLLNDEGLIVEEDIDWTIRRELGVDEARVRITVDRLP
jgi:hypothetical protein